MHAATRFRARFFAGIACGAGALALGLGRPATVRAQGADAAGPYGVDVTVDDMVAMRDGVRLAFDVYRPACDGAFVDGRFPTIMLHTPYDKTDRRYSEIADFFVPHGYNVVLVDLRDRYRSEA